MRTPLKLRETWTEPSQGAVRKSRWNRFIKMNDVFTKSDALDVTEPVFNALTREKPSALPSSSRLQSPSDKASMLKAIALHNRLYTQLGEQLRVAARINAAEKNKKIPPSDPSNPDLDTFESLIVQTTQRATFVDGASYRKFPMTLAPPSPFNWTHAGISQVNTSSWSRSAT